jgi:regulator of PEP synthase PpsR (kinase-PPPase family)
MKTMASTQQKQSVFFVSDRTGKTAQSIGMSLLTQFNTVEFIHKNFSFITSVEDAMAIAKQIEHCHRLEGKPPIVISTIVDKEVEDKIAQTGACLISLFNVFIDPLEKVLGVDSSHSAGMPHEGFDDQEYLSRIDAIDYTLRADDGMMVHQLDEADIILVGVSRSAKTPTCLYLAMNFSLKAANYPLTEDDLDKPELPAFLEPYLHKTVGLTINAERLSAIRQQRRPDSTYASIANCQNQVLKARKIMERANISMFDSTSISIEEIAVRITKEKHLLQRN